MNRWKSLKGAYVKRILSCTLALGLCIGAVFVSPMLSSAADKVDLAHAVSLRTQATSSTDPAFVEDIGTAKVVMDIYKVADAVAIKNVDGYSFEVVDPYSGLVNIPKETDAKTWYDLSQDAASVIKAYYEAGTPIEPDTTIAAGQNASGLAAGLYLVIAREDGLSDYFVEEENVSTGNKEIFTLANGVENTYKFAPEFVALPTKEPDPVTGEIKTDSDSDWLYSATIYMKPSSEPRFGDLRIIKDLLTFENHDPATFVFGVEAVKEYNGVKKSVLSNVYSLSFTAAKENYLLIENIPVGAEVTVTELYSGATYTATTAASQSTVIVANEAVELRFTNDYTINRRHGGAITNHFDPVLDENGNAVLDDNGMPTYTWSKFNDSTEEVAK